MFKALIGKVFTRIATVILPVHLRQTRNAVNQQLNIAVEHLVHIPNGQFVAVILDQTIWRQYACAADLAAKSDLAVFESSVLRASTTLFSRLEFVQARAQLLRIAVSRFCMYCERSFWHCTTMPVGKCVMRTASVGHIDIAGRLRRRSGRYRCADRPVNGYRF